MTEPRPARLVRRPPAPTAPPVLDAAQEAVVAHRGGPLLVLAGPGTGKTTTLVETVVRRVAAGADPEQVLVLTFSRKAAGELRERVTARLGLTTREPLALTFHAYAWALLRREAVLAGESPPRLLTGAEHDLEIRRLLRGEVEDGATAWPEWLRPALPTRGFAAELRDLLLRAEERGLCPADLARLGRERDRPEWVAAAGFLDRYEGRFAVDPAGEALDQAQLVGRAAGLLTIPEVRERERAARSLVLVDEYQDTDPAQVSLLQQLAGGGRDLVAVGDPDQSIYAFRGAEARAVVDFPAQFPTREGSPAPVLALTTCRRSGPELLAASRRVASRLPAVVASGPRSAADHRALAPAPPSRPALDGPAVRVHLAESASSEAALVAAVLRRAHLVEGVAWPDMAVLVRSARASVPGLRRALQAARVPVTVAGDELPLVQEPGVRPLLLLLRCAVRPAALDGAAAVELLTGPLGRTDGLGVRRLRRALRELELSAGGRRSSGELLAASLADPRDLLPVRDQVARPAERVAALLADVGAELAAGATAEDVLWTAWSRSGLAADWEATSLAGGQAGAAADRDLDAVSALFDAAAAFVDRLPSAGAALFLDDLDMQEIPSDSLAGGAVAEDAVRVLTAHRSKGLEWRLVVVCGAQEGRWPDLRRRGSVLGADDLVESLADRDDAGSAAVTPRLLQEERRLFYVAATRARERLVVTAVGGGGDDEERPSRFLAELLPDSGASPEIAPAPRPLSLPDLVAELRARLVDPASSQSLVAEAAAQLAVLADEGVAGADPAHWYALVPWSDDGPLAGPEDPVRVSPSAVEGFSRCGLRWLLERVAGGSSTPGAAQQVGSLVHALAALAADPALADEEALTSRLDAVWGSLDLGGRWYSRRQREEAVRQLQRFLAWHRSTGRELVAVEQDFSATLGRATISGRVDRLERDEQGRGVVVDLKTGGSKPPDDELARHPQLGVYQLAVALGAFADAELEGPGGAALLQLGKCALAGGARVQSQEPLGEDADPDWAGQLVTRTVEGMSSARFLAVVNDGCTTCSVRTSCPLQPEGERVS
jgi:superfamily I DNA/RNA helicase/RecB family exonuclease